jgi:hypothetical protein
MTEVLKNLSRTASFGAFAAMNMPHMPRINFGPADDAGTGNGDNNSGDTDGDADTGDSDTDAGVGGDDDNANTSANQTEAEKKLLRDVMAKKAKLKDVTTELDAVKAQLAAFKDINLDEVKSLLAEKQTAALAAEEAKGNFDRVKEMMVEAHNSEKKALTDQIAALTTTLAAKDGAIGELTVGRSFSESKFILDELVLPPAKARALYGSHFAIEDGKVIAYDKPAGQADRTALVGADGKNLSFEDAMKKLINSDPERDSLIKVNTKPGAGSNTKKVEDQNKNANDKGLFGVSRIAWSLENKDK